MNRRAFLGAMGGAAAAGLAGCLGIGSGSAENGTGSSAFYHPGNLKTAFVRNGDYPDDPAPADGVPPEFGGRPAERSIDTAAFETLDVNGQTVKLAPIDVAKYWYDRGEARFVDARPKTQYEHAHIYGAVNSPAQPQAAGGPVDGWPTDDRVVAYCGCPHHLSAIRASTLQAAGYTDVYVIDEGFWTWHDRGYPMAGTDFDKPAAYHIDGRVDPAYSGAYAWATAVDSDQQEAAPIGDDGLYELHLRFSDISEATTIRVDTPAYSVTGTLADLVAGTVTG
ncbi:rhodanese-like domain-containing protein [Salarchaeum sp. JOR-1]|uniref:rhodanese-like domain-containing protein n=1 Tax=Salarchaeum sp. JOR-1 TaxID=2599399 RepID=UPI001198644F|nr:rhodanese-like domain-containing protein [Salarchaeum sp. JOR-1]QDX40625.1 rhodanese-like domain-containing protein [Salarchaeum sp. JOR-1]